MTNVYSDVYSAANRTPITVVDLLRRNAFRRGERLAYTFLVDGEEEKASLTYAELDQRSRAIGAALQQAEVAGKPVLLLFTHGLEFIAAFLGCLYAGAIAVPAYPPRLNRSQIRLRGIIEDSRAAMVLTTKTVLEGGMRALGEASCAENLRWLATDDVANHLADEWREPAINGDTLAMLQYTSGSTSAPKGVMMSHHNLLSNERMIHSAFRLTEDSTLVGWLPLYHDMGLIGIVLHSLFLGARSVLMPPTAFLQKPSRWLRAVSDYGAAFSGGPNFAYDLCVRKVGREERSRLDLAGWTVAFNGAEPIFHETLDQFAATFATCGFRSESFYPCYGLAEGTLFVSGGMKGRKPIVKAFKASSLEINRAMPADGEGKDCRQLVGCGRDLPGERILIVQPESLIERIEGEIGEVWVSGTNVARGYWERSRETEENFRAYLPQTGEGPFLRTGDLGFMLEGELFITGRLKDLIIIDGRNHYPQDIELTVEKSHHAIRSGCCAAFSIEFGGRERLVVAAELDRHYRNPDRNELIDLIRQAVAEHHELRVDHLWFLKTGGVPKTSSGKIQRRACRADFLSMMMKGDSDVGGTLNWK